jgi:isopentenyl-diphosphate delta-isomerase type 1
MEDLLILVDDNDEIIGYEEKMETHKQEKLHRAFSVFVFNRYDDQMLLHRRAAGKYHSGGLWTNACCSHPRKDENIRDAVLRRMEEELGLRLTEEDLNVSGAFDRCGGLCELGKFQYYQKYETCAEAEIDHVFYISLIKENIELYPNPEEISEIKWISVSELKKWLEERPQDFTAWFWKAFNVVLEHM